MTAASALTECFADLPDPRMERTRLHALTDILVIAICAVLCGAKAGMTSLSSPRPNRSG